MLDVTRVVLLCLWGGYARLHLFVVLLMWYFVCFVVLGLFGFVVFPRAPVLLVVTTYG